MTAPPLVEPLTVRACLCRFLCDGAVTASVSVCSPSFCCFLLLSQWKDVEVAPTVIPSGNGPCLSFANLPPLSLDLVAGYVLPAVFVINGGAPPINGSSIFFFWWARFSPVAGFEQAVTPGGKVYQRLAPADDQTTSGVFTFQPSAGPICTSALAIMGLARVEPLAGPAYWMIRGTFSQFVGESAVQVRALRGERVRVCLERCPLAVRSCAELCRLRLTHLACLLSACLCACVRAGS
jgi:hypothetical protein